MLNDWLRQQALSLPEKIGLITDDQTWDYRAMHRQVNRLSERLAAAGVRAGQHVAALLPNCPEAVFLVHALARLGAVLVPLNVRHSPLELSWQVSQADCSFLVFNAQTETAAGQIESVPLTRLDLTEWKYKHPSLRAQRGCTLSASNLPSRTRGFSRSRHYERSRRRLYPTASNLPSRTRGFSRSRRYERSQRWLYPTASNLRLSAATRLLHSQQTLVRNDFFDRTQAIVFTSGTSGKPKGAQLTFGNHFYSAVASAFRLGIDPSDCWLATLPLFHVGGLAIIFRSCLYGTTLTLQERFDPQAVLQAISEHAISVVSLTPTMLYRLLELPGSAEILNRLRLILLGGSAAPRPLLERALAAGINIALTYGMTETATQIATATPAETRRKPGTVGKPLMFCQARILDDNGCPLPKGKTGLIAVSGPTLMAGYYPLPGDTFAPTSDREFITGDLGYLDQDGDLWVVQRREDLIVSGGENIYPAEVEAALLAHPGIENACVVGVDDPEWGQTVAAALVTRRGVSLNPDELVAFSRPLLAGYKIPRRFIFLEQLPQTESGKVLRQQVLALFIEQNENETSR